MTGLLCSLYWLYSDSIKYQLVQYKNGFTLVFMFALFNNAGVVILEQFLALESFIFPFLMKN